MMVRLFRALRKLIHDFNNYGQEEISMLKRQVQDQKLILEELKKLKKLQHEQEEELMLQQLRKTVHYVKQVEMQEEKQLKEASQMLRRIEESMKDMLTKNIEMQATDVLKSIDLSKIILSGKPKSTDESAFNESKKTSQQSISNKKSSDREVS